MVSPGTVGSGGFLYHQVAGRSVPEIKQVLRLDFQHLGQFENHIHGDAHVPQLDGADMAAINVRQLRQLKLGQSLPLAVVNHIQSEFFI